MSFILLFIVTITAVSLYGHCVAGSRALIASQADESEPSAAVGEWMSAVLEPYTNDSSTACLLLDLKLEEFVKRIDVELIYQDANNTIQKTLLFSRDIEWTEKMATQRFVTFEFHLNSVLQYQVNAYYRCE